MKIIYNSLQNTIVSAESRKDDKVFENNIRNNKEMRDTEHWCLKEEEEEEEEEEENKKR